MNGHRRGTTVARPATAGRYWQRRAQKWSWVKTPQSPGFLPRRRVAAQRSVIRIVSPRKVLSIKSSIIGSKTSSEMRAHGSTAHAIQGTVHSNEHITPYSLLKHSICPVLAACFSTKTQLVLRCLGFVNRRLTQVCAGVFRS